MSAHTPGPWFNTTEDDKVTGSVGTSEFKNDIALCWSDSAKANARLIAAAPELIVMLEECAVHIAAIRGDSDPYAIRVFALIARATGGAA